MNPAEDEKRMPGKYGRRWFLPRLGAGIVTVAVLPIPVQAADNPREEHSAMLAAARDQKVEKVETSSQSTLPPTEYVIGTSTNDNKALADKLLPKVRDLITNAHLDNLGVKIHIVDPDNPLLPLIPSINSRAGGVVYGEKMPRNMYLSTALVNNIDPAEIIFHEVSHLLDPRNKNLLACLPADQVPAIQDAYSAFQTAFTNNYLLPGDMITSYDNSFREEGLYKAGTDHWSYFLNQIPCQDKTALMITREELVKIAGQVKNPTYQKVINEFINSQNQHLVPSILGKLLAQGYWKDGDSFLNGTGSSFANLKASFDKIYRETITETWGDMGQLAIRYPKAAKILFPEFYEAYRLSFQAVSGTTLEKVSYQLRQTQDRFADLQNHYRSFEPNGQSYIKKGLKKLASIYQNPAQLSEFLENSGKDLKQDFPWYSRQRIAVCVAVFLEDPENLGTVIGDLQVRTIFDRISLSS